MLRWLRENAGSLLLAILLSLTIWVAAVQQKNPIEQRTYPGTFPVVTNGLAPGLVIVGGHMDEVQVSLRTTRETWSTLRIEDITVLADLSELSAGTHQVPLTVDLSERIRATNIQVRPAEITITLEEERQRDVPIKVRIEGQPEVGFEVDKITITDPNSVTVSGPLSLVDRVSEVDVSVDVEGARENIQAELVPYVFDSQGGVVEDLTVEPALVQVTVRIIPKPDFREVSVIARHEGAPAFGYYVSSINVSPLSVTIQGPPAVIDEMPGFVETTPVDLTGLQESVMQSVGLVLPEGVVAVNQTAVEVRVEIASFQGSLAVRRRLEVVGLRSGLEAIVSPDTVDLILSGSVTVFERLTEDDVRVLLDLSDLSVGTYQVEPEVIILPSGIANESILPGTIEVRIQPESTKIVPTAAPIVTPSSTEDTPEPSPTEATPEP